MATGTAYATLRSTGRGVDSSDDETSESSSKTATDEVVSVQLQEDLMLLASDSAFEQPTDAELRREIQLFREYVEKRSFTEAKDQLAVVKTIARKGASLFPTARGVYIAIRQTEVF